MFRSSYPYLSGDFFSRLADYSVPRIFSEINEYKLINANILFIPSDISQIVLEEYRKEIKCKVLISGNSDFEFRNTNLVFPKEMERAYLQNSFISDNKRIFTLPIGIENIRYARNGFKSSMKKSPYSSKKNRVLIGPFSPTSPEREKVLNTFSSIEGPWDVISERVSPLQYPQLQSQYKFVLCPTGNGIDTHRVWETIYRGGFPIVLDDAWSRSLAKIFPLLLIKSMDSTSELNELLARNSQIDDYLIPEEAFGLYWKKLLTTIRSTRTPTKS